jgi:hypothetical protein
MCVIIVREPNIQIPFDKLSAACTVNPDGWGLAVPDRGKIEIIKEYNPKGNSPDEIMKRLEDAKDQRISLHLRYATHGKKDIDNTHPFLVTTKERSDHEIHLMHNGVLGDFTKFAKDYSDTWHFNEMVVKRLIEDSIMRFGSDWHKDEFTQNVLMKFCGGGNKLSLIDDSGNVMIVNKGAGQTYEGWWASNTYSFQSSHRSSGGYGSHYGGGYEDYNWEKDANGKWIKVPVAASKEKSNSTYYLPRPNNDAKGDTEKKADGADALDEVEVNNVVNLVHEDIGDPSPFGFADNEYRPLFTDMVGIDDLEEMCKLTPDTIRSICVDYPEVAAILVMDLLYALYITEDEYTA